MTSGILLYISRLNTGLPTFEIKNSWTILYKVTGYGIFAQIPLVSTAQELTITQAEFFKGNTGTWESLTVNRIRVLSGYHRVEFKNDMTSLVDGLYLCRLTGKMEIN